MKKYPEKVITFDKKGNREVRLLVDKGKFVRYKYMDPASGKIVEKGKFSIILRNEKGKEEHLYIIPLQKNKALVVWPSKEKKKRKVWSKEKSREINLF
jgi:hypothetical protein